MIDGELLQCVLSLMGFTVPHSLLMRRQHTVRELLWLHGEQCLRRSQRTRHAASTCLILSLSLTLLTARVKISKNVDILAKVYLVHLKVKHCQTLRVVSIFTGENESTVFNW